MIPEMCVWEHLTEFSHEVSDNGIYYTTLEAVKTSCSKKTMWLPTIKSNTDVNIIDPTLDFEYCPFCGCDISNNKGNFYNWQNIETVATKMSLRYDTLMQEKDNPTAKQSFELDIFRSWGGLETNDLAFKEWVIATISGYNNQPIQTIVNKLKTEHITFDI